MAFNKEQEILEKIDEILVVLKGKPGEPGLEEQVRENTDKIKKIVPQVEHYYQFRQKVEGMMFILKYLPQFIVGALIAFFIFLGFIGQSTYKTQKYINEMQKIITQFNPDIVKK